MMIGLFNKIVFQAENIAWPEVFGCNIYVVMSFIELKPIKATEGIFKVTPRPHLSHIK